MSATEFMPLSTAGLPPAPWIVARPEGSEDREKVRADIVATQKAIGSEAKPPLALDGVFAKVYDLSNPDSNAQFCQDTKLVESGIKTGLLVVHRNERRFVHGPCPTWMAFLEWWQYVYVVKGRGLTYSQYQTYLITERIPEDAK